ncbi:MAG: hypothetical protein CMO01_09440, partial [Thalassobius sp.]|nr:hypothetical protein [Thalassovita sp.]
SLIQKFPTEVDQVLITAKIVDVETGIIILQINKKGGINERLYQKLKQAAFLMLSENKPIIFKFEDGELYFYPKPFPLFCSYNDALRYCEQLNQEDLDGYETFGITEWRLPKEEDVKKITDIVQSQENKLNRNGGNTLRQVFNLFGNYWVDSEDQNINNTNDYMIPNISILTEKFYFSSNFHKGIIDFDKYIKKQTNLSFVLQQVKSRAVHFEYYNTQK